jgi:hypothetical protein
MAEAASSSGLLPARRKTGRTKVTAAWGLSTMPAFGSIARPQQRLALVRTILDLTDRFRDLCLPDHPRGHNVEAVLIGGAVLLGHVQGRPMTVSNLSDYLDISRTTTARKLGPLIKSRTLRRSGDIYLVNEDWINSQTILGRMDAIGARVFVGARELEEAANMDAVFERE